MRLIIKSHLVVILCSNISSIEYDNYHTPYVKVWYTGLGDSVIDTDTGETEGVVVLTPTQSDNWIYVRNNQIVFDETRFKTLLNAITVTRQLDGNGNVIQPNVFLHIKKPYNIELVKINEEVILGIHENMDITRFDFSVDKDFKIYGVATDLIHLKAADYVQGNYIKLKSNFNNDISRDFMKDVKAGMYLRYYDVENNYQICDILSVSTSHYEHKINEGTDNEQKFDVIEVLVNKNINMVINNDVVIGEYNNWLGRLEKQLLQYY